MIEDHIEAIWTEFRNLLKDGKIEGMLSFFPINDVHFEIPAKIKKIYIRTDLKKMVRVLYTFHNRPSLLVQKFESYVFEMGSKALEDVCEEAKSVSHKCFNPMFIEVCGRMFQ